MTNCANPSFSIKKNDRLELAVTGTDRNGNGVAHAPNGQAVFIRNTCAGDVVNAKIIKVLKHYTVAIPEEILQPSADRSVGGCAVSGKCGGCVFGHMTYEAECRYKAQSIDDAFARIGGLSLKLNAFHSSPKLEQYRNKAIYPVSDADGKPVSGFYAAMSHRIVQHEVCEIAHPLFPKIRDAVLLFAEKENISAYNESARTGILRGIYMRSAASEEIVLTLILADTHFGSAKKEMAFVSYITEKFPNISSVLINTNTKNSNAVLGEKWRTLSGDGYLHDELCGKKFRVSPASFWQVNHDGAELLYGIAARFAALKPGEKLLDLYCGTGSVGISIARPDTRLYGVEIVADAVKDASFNAKANGIDADFLCLDAAHALDDERLKEIRPQVITVDPPRKGCGIEAVRKIASLGAERIVYISCDPATLARDLAEFEACGYKAVTAEGVDMFPRTGHVETVVLLSKGEVDSKKIRVEFSLEDMDMSEFQDGATYAQLKDYVLEHSGLKVSNLYISQIKRKCGIGVGKNYNLPKSEDSRQPQCPPEKEKAIREAFKYFGMI